MTVPPPGPTGASCGAGSRTRSASTTLPLDLSAERENPSLGVPETSLLRTINERVTSILAPPDYRPLVRELLAHQTLSRGVSSARLGLSPDDHAWVRELSARLGGDPSAERGYDVAGDLNDLRGLAPGDFADPDTTGAEELLPPALDAIERAAGRGRPAAGGRGAAPRRAARGPRGARPRPPHPVLPGSRRKIVTWLEDSAAGRGTLEVYRRARGKK